MIKSSLEIGPANEKVRQKLMIPFSFVISPGSVNANIQTISEEVQTFPRCENCGAYFSKNCKKDESNFTWFCGICSHQNNLSSNNKEEGPKATFPEITSDDFQFVKNNQLGEEITVIYLSLNFHPQDFNIITNSVNNFLSKSDFKKPLLFLLAHSESDFSILAPYQSKYFLDSENNNVISKITVDLNESNTDTNTKDLPAPVFNLSTTQLKNADLSKFIFSPDQYSNIIKTLEKITSIPQPLTPFRHLTNSIDAIRLRIQGKNETMINPIHFVSIIPPLNEYFSSRYIKQLYDTLIRIDILTPTYNNEVKYILEVIPGTVCLFNSSNLTRNLCKLLSSPYLTKSSQNSTPDSNFNGFGRRGHGTIYQWNSLARSSGSKTNWRLARVPFFHEEKGFAFSPLLPSTEHPIVLDIHPDGSSDYVNVQITAKMFMSENPGCPSFYSSVLRVFNRKICLSSDVKKIAESIDANTLLWLWMTRTLEQAQRDVLAALYRATARIVKAILGDQKEGELIERSGEVKSKIERLVHGCCSLKFSDLMSDSENLKEMSRYALVVTSPEFFRMVPLFDEQKKFAVFGNTVYFDVVVDEEKSEDGEERKAKKKVTPEFLEELSKVLFLERAASPIPDWCKAPDEQTLEFIHSLVSE